MSVNGDVMSNECAFIDDGYTVTGYIARRPGLHPAITFEFRAMTQPECARAKHHLNNARTPEEGEGHAAGVIAKRLVSWDIKKRDGKMVDITQENVIRVQPMAFYDMWCQVLGVRGPDAMPRAENAADLHTTLAGERQEDVDTKN